jgi:SIR2-like domain
VTEPDSAHFLLVANRIKEGRVIPFLGAGANRCDRPDDAAWGLGQYLPDGAELAHVLADKSGYPDTTDTNLLRVSQYLDAVLGEGALYDYLHDVFAPDYPFNSLHELLAKLPPLLRERGLPHQLIITTNYDRALEDAFDKYDEEYDLVWYEAKKGELRGRFIHRAPGADPVPIERANKYGLSREQRTVILKLHGAVHGDKRWDSYVITENSYIDYLSQGDISSRIPILLLDHMRESHFLFLGYSMRDWNLRVILNRIWGTQQLDRRSWAVQREPNSPAARAIEEALWRDRGDVTPIYISLKEYIARLGQGLNGASAQASG